MGNRDGKRSAIFGKSGSGKTVLADSLCKGAERLFVFDPKGSWLKREGFEVLHHFSQIKPFLKDMGSEGSFRAVYVPETLKAPKRLSTLSMMLLDAQTDYFWGSSNKKLTFVVDELADAFPLALPKGCGGFAEYCQKGREFGGNVLGITQRPASVHAAFRGNLDVIASFNFSFVNDRKAVAKAMEDEAVEDAVSSLEQYHYVWWEDVHGWSIKPPAKP